MKNQGLKLLPLLAVAVLLFLFSLVNPKYLFARSGCCSHHGGVCGCGCCDGTSLSSTCAPYYPECGGGRVIQIATPKPTATSKPKATVVPTLRPTDVPEVAITSTPEAQVAGAKAEATPVPTPASTPFKPNALDYAITLGVPGYVVYRLIKKSRSTKTQV